MGTRHGHIKVAETMLEAAEDAEEFARINHFNDASLEGTRRNVQLLVAKAQAHATLAVALTGEMFED